jgi:hypothetical protein
MSQILHFDAPLHRCTVEVKGYLSFPAELVSPEPRSCGNTNGFPELTVTITQKSWRTNEELTRMLE